MRIRDPTRRTSSELEGTTDQPYHARQSLAKLQTLDADYRALHLEIIDLIDEK